MEGLVCLFNTNAPSGTTINYQLNIYCADYLILNIPYCTNFGSIIVEATGGRSCEQNPTITNNFPLGSNCDGTELSLILDPVSIYLNNKCSSVNVTMPGTTTSKTSEDGKLGVWYDYFFGSSHDICYNDCIFDIFDCELTTTTVPTTAGLAQVFN